MNPWLGLLFVNHWKELGSFCQEHKRCHRQKSILEEDYSATSVVEEVTEKHVHRVFYQEQQQLQKYNANGYHILTVRLGHNVDNEQ